MVIPPKQTPHVPVQGDETNFHALLVNAPKTKSVKLLKEFLDVLNSGMKIETMSVVYMSELAAALEDVLMIR